MWNVHSTLNWTCDRGLHSSQKLYMSRRQEFCFMHDAIFPLLTYHSDLFNFFFTRSFHRIEKKRNVWRGVCIKEHDANTKRAGVWVDTTRMTIWMIVSGQEITWISFEWIITILSGEKAYIRQKRKLEKKTGKMKKYKICTTVDLLWPLIYVVYIWYAFQRGGLFFFSWRVGKK